MGRIVLLFLIITSTSFTYAVSISGILTGDDNKPVVNQQVFLNNGYATYTNDIGAFQFMGVMPGSYELKTEQEGQTVILHFFSVDEQQTELALGTIVMNKNILLKEVLIKDRGLNQMIERMPDVKDNVIFAAKKTEVVKFSTATANLAQNNSRQLFARVPGVHVWENDGSGIQMGIATRGLNPNRMWEFNTRQNGYDISSDPFGYPEAYYTPSVESLERIEIIRGASSIQYGAQFGGVVNYIKKKSVSGKPIGVESMQTLGSYGMFSSFNAIGGTIKNFSYYANINYRRADGWRDNSGYETWNGFVNFGYKISKKIHVNIEYTRMDANMQQAGGLTDSMFRINPRQSVRNRNWFNIEWNIAAINFDYRINNQHSLQIKAFGLVGKRYSIGNMSDIHLPETKDSLGRYSPRRIDKDDYENFGTEIRHLFTYTVKGKKQYLSSGVRFFRGNTYRIQNRNGSRDEAYNLEASSSVLHNKIHYISDNMAAFAEHLFTVTNRLSITAGLRYEYLYNKADGFNNINSIINRSATRQFIIGGLGIQYKTSSSTTVYANATQAYRPVLFSDLTVATTDSIDNNLKDASGYNIDLGIRGNVQKWLTFDVSLFYLHYGNRIGNYVINGRNFTTNIGTSVSKGIESYVEASITEALKFSKFGHLQAFASLSFIDATYVDWNTGNVTNSIKNKRVEHAPPFVHRYGFTYRYKKFSLSMQQSYVGAVYSNSANTEAPTVNGVNGKIPEYRITDLSWSLQIKKNFQLNGGINNLTDEAYFTRRAGGYPGPGLLPSEGRTWYIGAGLKF